MTERRRLRRPPYCWSSSAAGMLLVLSLLGQPNPVRAFDTGHHYDLTREALQEEGFGNAPVKIVQVNDWLVDYYSNPTALGIKDKVGHLHFDNLYSTEMVTNYWGQFAVNTHAAVLKAVQDNDPLELLTIMGMSLHSVQDFYTHSNWVETHPAPADGSYRTDTWFSSPPKAGDPVLHTGWYKDDPGAPSAAPVINTVPPELVPHGDYTSGLNHDSYVRPGWDRSYVFAYAGCREWVNAIRTWVNNPAFWDRARTYSVTGDDLKALNKDVDAAYRISEWVATGSANGHWKGNGSGSLTDFAPAEAGWIVPPTSTYVTTFKGLADALTPNLKDGTAATAPPNAAVPAVPVVSFDKKAVLVRTLHVQETSPPVSEAVNVKADFYARVSVANQAFVDAMQMHSDDIHPSWSTIKFLPHDATTTPVHYELWDERNVGGGQCDINPAAGKNALDFTYSLADHSCTGDITGVHDSAASSITSQGDGGPQDLVQFYVTSIALQPQTGAAVTAPQNPDAVIAALPPTLDSGGAATGGATGTAAGTGGAGAGSLTLLMASAAGVGTSITLANVKFDNGAAQQANTPLSGQGDLTITLAGMSAVAVPACPFHNLVFDNNGVVSGGGITLSADLAEPNVFGTGMDLTFSKGSQVVVVARGESVKISSSMKAALPFFSSAGDQAEADFPNTVVAVDAAGNFDLNSQHVTLSGPVQQSGLSLAGFNFKASDFNIQLKNKVAPASLTFSVTANQPVISTNIPNLLCQDNLPLQLKADSATIDQSGLPSFSNASLAVVKDGSGNPAPQVLHLAQPLDFALTVKTASATFANGAFTDFSVTADLTLPDFVKGDDGDLVKIEDLEIGVKKGFVVAFDIPTNKPLDLNWDGFGVKATGHVIVDLSSGAASTEIPADAPRDEKDLASNPAWEGVYFQKISLLLPSSITGSGSSATVPGTNFLIDSHGISGTVAVGAGVVPTLSIDSFAATLDSATFTFQRGALTTGTIHGSIAIPAWDNQKVAINASVSPSGLVTVGVDLQNPLTVSSLGMQVALSGGSIQIADDGSTRLMLTGAFAFPGIPQFGDAALQFANLGIGSDGKIYLPNSNWITLPHPATIDLSVLSLDCTQIGFGQDSSGLWVGLTGGVTVSADLPVSGDVQFDGLTIHAGANGNGPSLSIGGVHLVAEVQNVATIEAELGQKTVNGVNCLYGGATLALDFAGGGGMGGSLNFLVSKGAWFVAGAVDLPGPIPLGQSGLAIFGFEGGLGQNVKVRDGLEGPPMDPINDVIPQPGSGSWIFMAGVTIGTTDGVTAWGPVALTVGINPLSIDLNGTFYFLQPVSDTPSTDRYGYVDINWASSTDTFKASLGAQFIVPGDGLNLVQANGYMELLLSPTDKHIWIGWPFDQHAVAIQITDGLLTLEGGAAWDIQNSNFQARLVGDESLGSVCSGHLDASANGKYNPSDLLHSLQVYGQATFDGNADFGVFSASVNATLNVAMLANPPTFLVNGSFTATADVPGGSASASADVSLVAIEGQGISASLSDIGISVQFSASQAASDVGNAISGAASDVASWF